MDEENMHNLRISIPHSGCSKAHKETSIRREPNLKLQHRVATPTQTNPKDIWKIRPATPSTLKNFPQPDEDSRTTIENQSENRTSPVIDDNKGYYKQNLRAKLSLDLGDSRKENPFTVPRGRSKSENHYIRREPNLKLINRQNTPMTDEGQANAFLSSPSILRTVTISPLARHHPNSHSQTNHNKDAETSPDEFHHKKKYHKHLTVTIPTMKNTEDIKEDTGDTIKPPLLRSSSDKYVRREKNLKVMYRVPTPITSTGKNMLDLRPCTPCTVPSPHIAHDKHEDVNNNEDKEKFKNSNNEDDTLLENEAKLCGDVKTHRSKKSDKKLLVDITKLYEDGRSDPRFVRRETNLKVLHRQDTPALCNYVDHHTDTFKYLERSMTTS